MTSHRQASGMLQDESPAAAGDYMGRQPRCQQVRRASIHHQEKRRTSLILINQDDRVFVGAKTIINEVKRVCHKGFWDSSTKKRRVIRG